MPEASNRRRQRGEGGLFQRSDGRWVGRIELGWRDGRRQRRTVYGKTMAECQRKMREARAQIEAGGRWTSRTPLAQWLGVWLEEIAPGKAKMTPNTLRSYDSYCRNYLMACLGRVKLDELSAQHVRELHRYVMVTKGLSPTTAGHAHAILSTALNDAIRDGLITRNPCELVDHPRGAVGNQRRALALDEVRRLAHVLNGRRNASRWLTALMLGLRQGECLGLRWSRIDLAAGTITVDTQLQRIPYVSGEASWYEHDEHGRGKRLARRRLQTLPGYDYTVVKGNLCLVTTKTESSRRVLPVPDVLLDELRRHHFTSGQPLPGDPLVWTTPEGGPIEPTSDRREWHELLALANVEDTDLHSARHTTSTLLLALGIPEDVRMAILGHSSAAARKVYSHVDLELARRAMAALEGAITEAS